MKKVVAFVLVMMIAVAVVADEAKRIKADHETFIYPVVKVRTKSAGGSGTIVRSEKEDRESRYNNYVLTNFHVISSAISYAEEFNTLTKQKEDVEKKATVEVKVYPP